MSGPTVSGPTVSGPTDGGPPEGSPTDGGPAEGSPRVSSPTTGGPGEAGVLPSSGPHRLLRELGEADRDGAYALGTLAFGGDPTAPVPAARAGRRSWGVFEGDRLVATAAVRDDEQWWGGQPVRMAGIAGVAVHPDARGRGAAGQLVHALIEHAHQARQSISVLFPTAPGIYRSLGWEVVGALEETRLAVSDLREVAAPSHVQLRSAGPEDLPALARLWREHGSATNGQLTRTGPCFSDRPLRVLEADVVTLAEVAGEAVGYLSYDRGRGYGPEGQLQVNELVAAGAEATRALLHALGTWDSVVSSVRWRGPTDDLGLVLRRPVPPPYESRPWMLRVLDAPAAVAARGYPSGPALEVSFTLVDPQVPSQAGAWGLKVRNGRGRLERVDARPDLPVLQARGLALLYAGVDDARVRRAGLLEGELPELAAAFAGPRPQLLDYF